MQTHSVHSPKLVSTSRRVAAASRQSTEQARHRHLVHRAFEDLLLTRALQAKLTISHPNDASGQQGDRAGDEVVRRPDTSTVRHSLAHDLTHVSQQRDSGAPCLQRAEFQQGKTTVQVDYDTIIYIDQSGMKAAIESRIAAFTGNTPDIAQQTRIAALSTAQQRWLLFGVHLLESNTTRAHSALDRDHAVAYLVARASVSTTTPLAPGFDFEREVMRESRWFEVALTQGLTPPSATDRSAIDVIANPPPTSGSATDPLDLAMLQRRLPPALRVLLSKIDPANWPNVGTRSIAAFQSLGDIIMAEAREFFSPWADSARGSIFGLVPSYQASANIFDATAMTPTHEQRLGYLMNRAQIVGTNTETNAYFPDPDIFADANYNGGQATDRQELYKLIVAMEADPVVAAQVDRLLQTTGRQSGSGAAARIGLTTAYNASRWSACSDHWNGLQTLCHEVLHALVHPNFSATADGVSAKLVVREGFTEVLGVQLFNQHILPKAASSPSFRATLEAAIGASAPCPAPAAATVGYGSAGTGAQSILSRVGDERFRAAYFLGKHELVGL
jgi:hypothetical protein